MQAEADILQLELLLRCHIMQYHASSSPMYASKIPLNSTVLAVKARFHLSCTRYVAADLNECHNAAAWCGATVGEHDEPQPVANDGN